MSKVSVILPVYNSENYLRDCLLSVLRQSLSDIEVICVNDGSTDSSLDILEEFASKDSRIKIINQENSGAGCSRNNGFEVSNGKYVIFLDSDDIFEENMLENFYTKAESENSDIVISNSYEYDDKTQQVKIPNHHLKKQYLPRYKQIFNYKDIPDYIFNFSIGWAWDKFYKRDFIKFNKLRFQNLRQTNDVYFVFMSLVFADKISILDKPLIKHRINTGKQLSETRNKEPLCFIQAIDSIKTGLENAGLYEFVKKSYINWVMEHSVWQWRTTGLYEIKNKLINEVFPIFNILNRSEEYFYDKIAYGRLLQMTGWENIGHLPKVSVVIPVYNVEKYLAQCIKSVTEQSLKDIEIICVNDGSTDCSLDILEEFAQKDKRIKIVNQKNSGMGKAYNAGIDLCRGMYIGFVEPDDYIKPKMFETLYYTAVNNDVDFVKSDFINFTEKSDDTESYIYRKLNTDGKFYNKRVKMGDSITPFRFIMNTWCGIYKREFIQKHNIKYNETPGASYQDNGFWFQTFCLANYGYFIDIPLYMHRADNPNASVKSKEKVFCMKEEYDFIREFLERNPKIKEKYLGIYHYKKYHNYMFTMQRIAPEYREDFLKVFTKDFKAAYSNNEIDESIFRNDELERLHIIVNNPEEFLKH